MKINSVGNLFASLRPCGRLCLAMTFGGILLVTTGCETAREWTITGRLWNGEDSRRFSDPAPQPHIQLSEARNAGDILVQYDSITGRDEHVKRRAFLLDENRLRLANHQKPIFMDKLVHAD